MVIRVNEPDVVVRISVRIGWLATELPPRSADAEINSGIKARDKITVANIKTSGDLIISFSENIALGLV
jgi:hypothetical protein